MALTPDETEELRRIHVLAQFGELPDPMQARYDELRERDDHLEIAEPTLDVQWMPVQRSRENALDDAVDALLSLAAAEEEYEGIDVDVDIADEVSTDGMTIAQMAQLQAAMSGNDFYVPSPYTGGFAPSSWYNKN
ncbi:MAG: hypothetical protein JO214_16515 [Frankiaceae bacterium]|nr:hypothetical protein [Frankiaceae bacterium]